MPKSDLGCIVRGSEFHRNFKNGTLRTMDTHRTGPWFGTFPSSSVGVLCFGDCPFVLNLTYLETPKPQKISGGLPPPGPPALKGRLLRGCRKLREIAIFTNFKKKSGRGACGPTSRDAARRGALKKIGAPNGRCRERKLRPFWDDVFFSGKNAKTKK